MEINRSDSHKSVSNNANILPKDHPSIIPHDAEGSSSSMQEIAYQALDASKVEISAKPTKTALKIPGKTAGVTNAILSVFTDAAAIGTAGETKKRNKKILEAFHNPKSLDPTGQILKWECTDVAIPSGSRLLEGMFFKSTAPPLSDEQAATKQTVLICSGSHQSCEHYTFPMVQSLTAMGHDVLIFNYSGFGGSQGKASEKHIYQDTVAAFDAMEELAEESGSDSDHLKVLGYSLGGAAAAYLGTVRGVDVVLDRTFHTMLGPVEGSLKDSHAPKMFRSLSKMIYNRVTTFDTESRISALKGRCLLVNGINDQTMGPSTSRLHLAAQRAMDELGDPEKFIFFETNSQHDHDPWGLALLSRVKVLGMDEEHQETFKDYQRSSPDLWFGGTFQSAPARAKLDEFLRYGPSSQEPLEDVA
ncbi:MAG: alpha/beta hydrolase [Chlamydiales bacterium]|nr:alpha/beta hydrolase [Chlamydiales bacterium]